jgi:hypothetical protein
MEDLGDVVAVILFVLGVNFMLFGLAQAVGNLIQRDHCEFVNEAQRCHKVFLPGNHEYFKED